ncbi:MAG: hypothetical protein Q8N96_01575 [Methylovulum sp.]|nr:hypothetical protein [Methylovulum sp.]
MSMLEQFEALEQQHIQTCLHTTGVELYHCFQNGKPQAIPSFVLEYEENKEQPWGNLRCINAYLLRNAGNGID